MLYEQLTEPPRSSQPQPWDASHYRKTLDTLGERFDVQVGPAHH
jgi:hypothetical protein